MSITFVSRHAVKAGDTVESLVRDYRFSSWKAISDIPANASLRSRLPTAGSLPAGMVIGIPPHALRLCKERLYVLHRLRPALLSHFDEQLSLATDELRAAILAADVPAESGCVDRALASMETELMNGIDELAAQAWALVDICVGMSHTHVADRFDRMASGSTEDHLCGLYWALMPSKFRLWQEVWAPGVWKAKWLGSKPGDAWRLAEQRLNTVRSIVVQQIDQRIREAQSLEQQLRFERAS